MAVKGQGYAKTTWAFEERPVASSKLNSWDDRIESSLELIFELLTLAWGGGDGVLRGAAVDDLSVFATVAESMSVEVRPGLAFISKFPYRLVSATQTVDVVAPVSDPRIELVQARLSTWDVSIKEGTESATPVAPSPDSDALALGELFLRVGMTSIKDVDDSTNGYITDVRVFL